MLYYAIVAGASRLCPGAIQALLDEVAKVPCANVASYVKDAVGA
jgi:hypothetical protein